MEELKNEKKRFVDKIYIITDEMDSYSGNTDVIGWYDSNGRNITILMKLRNYTNMERQKMYL